MPSQAAAQWVAAAPAHEAGAVEKPLGAFLVSGAATSEGGSLSLVRSLKNPTKQKFTNATLAHTEALRQGGWAWTGSW